MYRSSDDGEPIIIIRPLKPLELAQISNLKFEIFGSHSCSYRCMEPLSKNLDSGSSESPRLEDY